MPITYDHDHEREITLFAETNFRNQNRRFGIKTDDRRRHMYVLGKTGMGKTTLLENLILSDIVAGHGCCYIDPHGDTAEKLIDFVPTQRINDVIYFNPADTAFPMGFNILETENDDQKPLVASGLMGVFKKIWPDVWSARMEYILMNCVLALLDYPGATLLGITRLLVDKEYRARVTAKIRDPIVKTFWVAEFASWSEKYATEAIAPVQNKVGQFLSSSVVRNIVAQVKSTLNFRQIMDEGKICIVNLSKGRIGEDNMRLLGGMVVTRIQLAAQERQNLLEHERRDFYLYVDEFQNFANESFATILSEARKYKLNLTIAHQYIEQLDEKVAPAIVGNVGTIILMRIGGTDAEFFETEFGPTFTPEDMVSLAKYQIYLKLMVDGVATPPFSANTMAPIAKRTGSTERVIQVSRERYAEPRASIEEKVLRWSGFEVASSPTQAVSPEVNSAPAPSAPMDAPASLEGIFSSVQLPAQTTEVPVRQYPRMETEDEREQRVGSTPYLNSAPATPLSPPPHAVVQQPTAPSAPQPSQSQPAEEVPFTRVVQGSSLDAEEMNPGEEGQGEYLLLKPERLAAIAAVSAAASQGKKKDRPKFIHTCSRCGKTWELAIQLDPTRPMYCPECRPIVMEEKKNRGSVVKQITRTPPPPEITTVHHQEASELSFAHDEQMPVSTPPVHKPRVTQEGPSAYAATALPRGTIKVVRDERTPPERLSMLEEIAQAKGQSLELDKRVLEARAGEPVSRVVPSGRHEASQEPKPTSPSSPGRGGVARSSAPRAQDTRSPRQQDTRPPRRDRGDERRREEPRRDDERRPAREPDPSRPSPSPQAAAPVSPEEFSDLNIFTPPVPAPAPAQARDEARPVTAPTNTATAKVLEKLLDRPKSSPLKRIVQAEPPPFPPVREDEDMDGLDLGLPASPPQPLQPGQRVTF